MYTPTHTTQGGFANLMGIIIVIALSIGVTLSLLTLDTLAIDRSLTDEAATVARINANSCAEIALFALKSDRDYTGLDSRALERGTCTALTANALNADSTHSVDILATGAVDDITQSARVTLVILAGTSSPAVLDAVVYTEVPTP